MNNLSAPSSVQIQPKIEDELEENALYELGQLIEQLVEAQKKEQPAARRRSQPPPPQTPEDPFTLYLDPPQVKKENQQE